MTCTVNRKPFMVNKNDNSSSVNREKINNTFEQLRRQSTK